MLDRLLLASFLLGPIHLSCAPGETEPTGSVPPNVVLITLDTLRADHLGCYGYPRDTSPNLDALAREAVLFERCLAPVATTLPSHVSMLTAVWPREHGVMANINRQFVYERNPAFASCVGLFRNAGYRTAAFVSAHPLRAKYGLAEGFQEYDEPEGNERDARATTDDVLAWLEARGEGPFLLWVHYFDPHSPYEARAPWDTAFSDDDIEPWLREREIPESTTFTRGKTLDTRSAADGYDGEIRFLDDELGRLFGALRSAGLDDSTVLTVVGDHGEGLGQHGMAGHGKTWNEQLQVPWLVRAPGLAPRRIDQLVSLVDVAPTLLGVLRRFGASELPGTERYLAAVSGVDTLASNWSPRPVVAISSPRQGLKNSEFSLTTERWKFAVDASGRRALYDLVADPHELANVAAANRDVVGELTRELQRLWDAQEERAGGTVRSATAAEIEAMRQLGYGGGAGEDAE